MAYFLGRDVAIGLTTEQPHYALELDSGDLKIAGHADNAYDADKVFVARRKDVGSTAETTTITITTDTRNVFESTATNNKYILVYSSAGDKYLIWFDAATDDAVKPTGLNEDFEQEVSLTGDATAANTAAEIRTAMSGDSNFAAAFTIGGSGAVITLLDKTSGSAVDAVRGSGLTNSEATVASSDGVNAALADLSTVKMVDITGVDFTFGAVDEDIAYFGQRTGLKAEVKNEITLSITRKKKDAGFSQLFNEARCGIRGTASAVTEVAEGAAVGLTEMNNNLNQPIANASGTGFGYRLYLQLKAGTEVLTLPNLCVSEYSVSLNADAVQEETIVFYGNVKPIISTLPDDTATTETNF